MNEPLEPADAPRSRRYKEYEDPHYHDDEDFPADEVRSPSKPPVGRRKPVRKPPTRRHYED